MLWRTKFLVKRVIKCTSPNLFARLTQYRNDRAGRLMRDTGFEHLTAQYLEKHGAVVAAGSFAGMRYVTHAHCSMLLPKSSPCWVGARG